MIRKRLSVCKITDLKPGTTCSFRFGVSNGIAYNDAGIIKAYVNRCTHMGGPVELARDGVFRCRWHEATFDPCSGCRKSGEAPEGTALTPIVLEIEGDQVWAVLEIKDDFE